jgi:uncharacterized membrane protein (DUF485 family)
MATKPKKKAAARTAKKRPAASGPKGTVNWAKLEASPEFVELKRAKVAFIVPAVIFFIVYYFTLPILVGYAPALMATKVFGALNVAYLFALSQFFMAWIIAALYVRAAGKFDIQAAEVAGFHGKGGRS